MKAKEVLKILNVSRVTLVSYVKKGYIKVTKLPNGYYDYDEESVRNFSNENIRYNVIYTRVSTHKQKDDLDRQTKSIIEYCKSKKIIVNKIFSEISSGIDLDRTQFNELLSEIFKFKIDKIYITHKDRLTRLSFITLSNIFKQFGTTIVSIFDNNFNTDDLFDEVISIMHYFSTQKYSKRKIINKKESI